MQHFDTSCMSGKQQNLKKSLLFWFGMRQANLVFVAYVSREGSGESAHPCQNRRYLLIQAVSQEEPSVKHQKILPRSNTQLYYNNGGHNNNLKTLRRFHDVDDVTVKDNQ